jgi:hypothetical protein
LQHAAKLERGPEESFDVESFSDYGKMRYDKHEASDSRAKNKK